MAARHARRRPARRLLPVRAARRVGPGRDDDPGGPRRRRLRASPAPRPGSRTAARPTSTRSWPAPPTTAHGISCFLVPADADGPHRRPARAQDGPDRLDDRDHALRRRRACRATACSAPRATASRSRSPASTPAGSASPPSPPGWPRAPSTTPCDYAQQRETFGKRIIDHQGLAFVLADMEAAVESARAITLHAARLQGPGLPFSREASIAKLVATDNAMKVTTDAVQVLGGAGYTRTSRSSATCARPRSCRSSKAPTRSSGWSSAALWTGNQPVTITDAGEALMQLDNTAAIVTGGASGLGAATAAALAGPRVPGSSPSTCRQASTRPRAVDGVTYVATDVTDAEQVAAAVAQAAAVDAPAAHGGQLRRHRPVRPDPRQEGRARPRRSTPRSIQINLIGTFNVLALASEAIAADRARRARASAASSSTRPPSPPTTARSARPPTPPPRAASSASPCRPPATWRSTASGCDDRPRHRRDADARDRLRRVPRRAWPPGCRSRSAWRAPRSTPSSRWRSSTTTTSTARSSGWTAPCGWRPAEPPGPTASTGPAGPSVCRDCGPHGLTSSWKSKAYRDAR